MIKIYLTENKTLMYYNFETDEKSFSYLYQAFSTQKSGIYIMEPDFTLEKFNNLTNLITTQKELGLELFKKIINE